MRSNLSSTRPNSTPLSTNSACDRFGAVSNKWFANRFQVIQTVCAVIACCLAGVKYFPAFVSGQYFTIGGLIFVFISASVVASFVGFAAIVSKQHANRQYDPPIPLAEVLRTSVPQIESSSLPELAEPRRISKLSCSSGISRIGKKADGTWLSEGSLTAAVVTLRNEANETLRNVHAYAHFYDNEGHKIAHVRLPWIDEEHDNTGFAPGQARSLAIASKVKEADRFFSTYDGRRPEPERLSHDNIAVDLTVVIDVLSSLETMHFLLSTKPYLSFTPVKP